MNFKIGKKIVCISDNNFGSALVKGLTYTIKDIRAHRQIDDSYIFGIYLEEIEAPRRAGFKAERFVPLEEGFEDKVLVRAYEDSIYDELHSETLEKL